MPGIIVKPRSRIFHGHDWVYSSEVRKFFGDPQPGDVVTLKDFRDRPLGTAIFNPQSQIVARRISRRKQNLDLEFFQRRLAQAIELRNNIPNIDAKLCRLVWSDSDALPGVVVDRYNDHLVLETQTLAMYQNRDIIVQALVNLIEPKSITLRNHSPTLTSEGIEKETSLLFGEAPAPFEVNVSGIIFGLNFQNDTMAALDFDQLEIHQSLAKFANGKKVLSVFSGNGAFALACAKGGAKSVTCIDNDQEALDTTRRNAEQNELNIETVLHNAFDYLKHCEESFDLIILDPPSLAQNKKQLQDALRGYKEIHLRSLKLLEKNGILSTHCSSHHISQEVFLENIVSASVDAKQTLRLLETHTQRLDLPVLPALPETNYLKGFTLQLTPSR